MFWILFTGIFLNNFVFTRFLGICPTLGTARQTSAAAGMGAAVTVVMVLAAAATWALERYFLLPLGAGFLHTVAFILVIAALVQALEVVLRRGAPSLHRALGIYLPLITTNCAVLGIALLNVDAGRGFAVGVLEALAAGLGFAMAQLLFAGLRERLLLSVAPDFLEGMPLALLTAGLVALAFLGFQGFTGL